MDIEFHYYITYLIALVAGFYQHEASKIAWSSQYIDDNKYSLIIHDEFEPSVRYNSIATQLGSIFTIRRKMNGILPIYHFLPGNPIEAMEKRKDGRYNILNTTPNSFIAKVSLSKAIESKNLYYIGIASHAFVDTWAHQNFIGGISDINKVSNSPAKLLPNLGHLDANIQPDLVGLIWMDSRLKMPNIDNSKRFLEASVALLSEYKKCSFIRKKVEFDNHSFFTLLNKIFSLPKNRRNIAEVRYLSRARIKEYNKLATKYTDLNIMEYNKHSWFNSAVKYNKYNQKYYWKEKHYRNSDWYQFQEAAKYHLHFVSKFVKNRLKLSH